MMYVIFADGTLVSISSNVLVAQTNVLSVGIISQPNAIVETAVFNNDEDASKQNRRLVIALMAKRFLYMIDLTTNWVSLVLATSLDRKSVVFHDNSLLITTRNTFKFYISVKKEKPFYFGDLSSSVQTNSEIQTIALDSNLFLRFASSTSVCLLQSLNLDATLP